MQPPQCRIGGAGEAHIDDAGAVVGGPLQALIDGERIAFGDAGLVVEGMHRQHLRARRDADQFAVRGDGAGHLGAVQVRRRVAAKRVEAFDDTAVEIGMLGVDFRNRSRQPEHFCPMAI